MGMFDYVRCDYPLPDTGLVSNRNDWQTKDHTNSLDRVVISAAGRLVGRVSHLRRSTRRTATLLRQARLGQTQGRRFHATRRRWRVRRELHG